MREVYMNPLQQRIYYSNAHDVTVVGARRFGKSDGVIGPRIYRVSMSMPRATNIWLGNSRSQLYKRTVPGTIAAICRFFQLQEGVHFGWGRPPASVPSPVIKPKTYDNVIWFANGTIWQLISLAVSGSANSITANHLVDDECRFQKRSQIFTEVMPAVSGIVHPFGDPSFSDENPLYKGSLFCSDAGLTKETAWLEDNEDKLDLIIESGPYAGKTYRDIQERLFAYADRVSYFNDKLRQAKRANRSISIVSADDLRNAPPSEVAYMMSRDEQFELAMIKNSKKYNAEIKQLQRYAYLFVRASTLDNIDIVGTSYIKAMERDLPKHVFEISILNKRKTKSSTGFYSNLDITNVHGYEPDDCPVFDKITRRNPAIAATHGKDFTLEPETPDFARLASLDDCSGDGDVRPDLPLYIAFDWGANINWVVTAQVYPRDGVRSINYLSSRFVKYERKLQALVEDWTRYYAPHRSSCRDVIFFYDATAKQRRYANLSDVEDFKDTVIRLLRAHGWNVRPIDMGVPIEHRIKHKEINEALAGFTFPAIRINTANNEAMILALQDTEIKVTQYRDGPAISKQKGGEKLAENQDEGDVLEARTDSTDAFDSLFIGIKHYLNVMAGMCMPSGRR